MIELKDSELKSKEKKSFHFIFNEFMNKPLTRTVLPVVGLVVLIVLFTILTDGRLILPFNIELLLSQTYMLMIASTGVFLIMTMGCLDFSQGSMLAIASIVVCYLSKIGRAHV